VLASLASLAPYVAELVGTFVLVFTVECNVLSGAATFLWAPTSIACVLVVMVYAFGPVSGGHLNPSVSLALGLSGKAPWDVVGGYIAVQLLAGIGAGFSSCALFGSTATLQPKDKFTWFEVMVVEALYTAMLAFVVLNVAASKRNNPKGNQNQFYGLAIGFIIVAGGYGAGPISGANFNPAVSLGIDLSSYSDGVYWAPAYILWQVIGAALAAILFRVARPEDFDKSEVEYERYEPKLPTKLACEFMGSFALVLTVCLCVHAGTTAMAWSAAAALMCMTYALGDVSGGHFNPAVTIAVVVCRRDLCPLVNAGPYIALQVAGGILAALMVTGLYDGRTFAVGVREPYTPEAALVLECIFTFVIALVVLSTATLRGIATPLTRNFYFALAIGSCVTAGGFASGAVSGGLMNPAVTFGIAISNTINHGGLYNLLTYALVQCLGGLLAALTFMVTHAKELRESGKATLLQAAELAH